MIYFEDLPLEREILDALGELKINYVFQSIYLPDGKTVYAREALMRPIDKTVMQLIDEYTKLDKLHILEVATFFGALLEYLLRGYTEYICLTSFPSEYFTEAESKAFGEYYGYPNGLGIIEILEYPYNSRLACEMKRKAIRDQNLRIAIDDFGAGLNDMDMVDVYKPDFVKLDRELISDIDFTPHKQKNVEKLVLEFHRRGMMVVAEGIEKKQEFNYLLGLGVDLFQGFYLSRPS